MPIDLAARPRVVATDLDGTLLHSDDTLSPRARAAIIAAERAGCSTVFVTARPPRWLDALADAVGPHGTVLCANGAFVYDVPRRRVVEQHTFDKPLLSTLIADLRRAIGDIAFAVERADGFGREPSFVDRFGAEYDVTDVGAMTASPVGKLLARSARTEPAEFHDRVAQIVADRAELGYSGAIGLAEITAHGVTKAAALARWCAGHGIDAAEVWAFGDMPNDLPMIRWAGIGFAVSNAHPDVLAAADRVCPSNDEDGVAQLLEQLC